jgi:hypothetical protein
VARQRVSPESAIETFELELTFEHRKREWCGEYRFWRSRDGKVIVVGYLCYDQDCSDPIASCDGSGKIETKHTDSTFLEHVGRDTEGEPILEEFFETIARLRGVEVEELNDDEEVIAIAKNMWEEAYERGKVGTPFAVPLDEAYHSGYREWSGRGTIDAVWVPDPSLVEHLDSIKDEEERKLEARRCFEAALEEYNNWAEGDCYGVVIDVFRREHKDDPYERDGEAHEACWGYVGRDYAEEELDATFESTKKYLIKKGATPCNSKRHSRSSALSLTA